MTKGIRGVLKLGVINSSRKELEKLEAYFASLINIKEPDRYPHTPNAEKREWTGKYKRTNGACYAWKNKSIMRTVKVNRVLPSITLLKHLQASSFVFHKLKINRSILVPLIKILNFNQNLGTKKIAAASS